MHYVWLFRFLCLPTHSHVNSQRRYNHGCCRLQKEGCCHCVRFECTFQGCHSVGDRQPQQRCIPHGALLHTAGVGIRPSLCHCSLGFVCAHLSLFYHLNLCRVFSVFLKSLTLQSKSKQAGVQLKRLFWSHPWTLWSRLVLVSIKNLSTAISQRGNSRTFGGWGPARGALDACRESWRCVHRCWLPRIRSHQACPAWFVLCVCVLCACVRVRGSHHTSCFVV